MALEPGAQFGRYELISRIGRGGMAETYRARLMGEAGVTKPVLIKKVLPEYANDDAFSTMFISEARISATLSHGNIAQVYDFGRVDGEYFLAMEFVDGQPLHRILKRALRSGLSSIPTSIATFIGIEMSRGLHYAHTRTDHSGKPLGIVHRDISPDNVLVSYEGQVKIVDFGIAKARDLRGFNTEPGVVKGKFLFFSPEQARGEEVDARTDVWATGIVLYELLCGQLPVQGQHYTVIPKLIRGEFPRPRALNPALPQELEDIIMSALEIDREKRIESSHELGDALAGFLYSTEPRFSAMSLSHFIKALFQEDLSAEGRQVQVPRSFLEQMARWQGAVVPTAPYVASVPRDEAPSPRALEPVEAKSSRLSGRKMMYLGIGAGVVLTVFVLVLVFVAMGEPSLRPPEASSAPQPIARPPVAPVAPHPQGTPVPEAPKPVPDAQPQPTQQKYEEGSRLFADTQYEQAARLAQDCLLLDSKSAPCLKLAGDAYAELKRNDEATQMYLAFLRVAPQDPKAAEVGLSLRRLSSAAPAAPRSPPSASAQEEAKAAYTDASRLMKARQYTEAVTLAARCLELNPGYAECEMILGSANASLSRMDEGAKHYRNFLQLAPHHPMAPKVRALLQAYEKSKR